MIHHPEEGHHEHSESNRGRLSYSATGMRRKRSPLTATSFQSTKVHMGRI
jgi:hypothetical protein